MNESKVVKGSLKQAIFNTANENVRALEALFPAVVKDGHVDFTALKEELGEFEEVNEEKYGLTWSGKQKAKKVTHEELIGKTLKFLPQEGKDIKDTQNIYIEGDNLEGLKLLRQNYYGAIKLIYIDPPYNTGKDFIYKDRFSMEKKESDVQEGDASFEEGRLIVNQKSANKYHSNWLNMMYPRLKIAKDLLSEDGVIFISIDENEVDNLKHICKEIFGEHNFAGEIIWKNSSKNDQAYISIQHEYIIAFVKNKYVNLGEWKEKKEGLDEIFKAFEKFKDKWGDNWEEIHKEGLNWYKGFTEANPIYASKHYNWMDENGVYFAADISGPNFGQYRYDVIHPITKKVCKEPASGWRYPEETMKERIVKNLVHFGKDETTVPNNKTYLKDTAYQSLSSIKYKDGRVASKKLDALLGGKYFTNPKDADLLAALFKAVGVGKNDIILDFFSGSATTAEVVMQLNAEDEGQRKFIMIQIPEECSEKSEAYKQGYHNICEIGKQRIKCVGDKIIDYLGEEANIDIGFKVFTIADTNIRWSYEEIKAQKINLLQEETQLQLATTQQIGNTQLDIASMMSDKDKLDFMPGFTDIDVVYELLLRQRDIPLSAKVEQLKEVGARTYLFTQSYLVCLETEITNELIEKIAALQPLPIKFIFRDSAFEDDINLKDEAIRRFKAFVARNKGEKQSAYTVEFI